MHLTMICLKTPLAQGTQGICCFAQIEVVLQDVAVHAIISASALSACCFPLICIFSLSSIYMGRDAGCDAWPQVQYQVFREQYKVQLQSFNNKMSRVEITAIHKTI